MMWRAIKRRNQKLLPIRRAVGHTSPPRHFSPTALTASKIRHHDSRHLDRLLLQELESVTEGLLILATAAERGADREHATDEPHLHRDLLRAMRGVAGDGHAVVNRSQQSGLSLGLRYSQPPGAAYTLNKVMSLTPSSWARASSRFHPRSPTTKLSLCVASHAIINLSVVEIAARLLSEAATSRCGLVYILQAQVKPQRDFSFFWRAAERVRESR
jgi:hypothetical protein